MMTVCPKCGSDRIAVSLDSRGVPSAHCEACDTFVKKMSVKDIMDYYEEQVIPEKVDDVRREVGSLPPKGVCRFCNENFFIRRGRLGTVYTPIEAVFCPMCGRKRKPEDRKY